MVVYATEMNTYYTNEKEGTHDHIWDKGGTESVFT